MGRLSIKIVELEIITQKNIKNKMKRIRLNQKLNFVNSLKMINFMRFKNTIGRKAQINRFIIKLMNKFKN